ncbi:MAG: hypothetical protein JSW40_05490, partial [Candidatus Omnitrophota bacterium]
AYMVSQVDIEDAMGHTLDILAQISGYTSLVAFSGKNEKCFFRGTRFIFEQPEFENVNRLKSLFYILEVKMGELQQMLFHYFDENIKFLIGDEIGFEEISDCSLIVSGAREKELSFALAILGPMRMDYIRAASCVCAMKNQLKKTIEEFLL